MLSRYTGGSQPSPVVRQSEAATTDGRPWGAGHGEKMLEDGPVWLGLSPLNKIVAPRCGWGIDVVDTYLLAVVLLGFPECFLVCLFYYRLFFINNISTQNHISAPSLSSSFPHPLRGVDVLISHNILDDVTWGTGGVFRHIVGNLNMHATLPNLNWTAGIAVTRVGTHAGPCWGHDILTQGCTSLTSVTDMKNLIDLIFSHYCFSPR